jgi:drug/metabolite transporter (DMT)-like permease
VIFWSRLSPPVQAALLMLFGASTVALMNCTIRIITEAVHPFEATFFRSLFGLIVILPLLGGRLWIVRTRRLGRLALMGGGHLIAMLLFFTALAHMPLAEVTALSFTKPLFTTLGAALLLREVVRARRWTAMLIGFAGVLIVLQPGAQTISPYAGLVLLSTVSIAGTTLLIKTLTTTESAPTIVLYQSVLMTLFSLPLCLLTWRTPDLTTWLLMALTGLLGTVGWLSFTRAFALADASAVMPFEFAKLPLTALIAYLLFAEVPTVWTWVGGAVIFGSTVYIAQREAAIARRSVARRPQAAAPQPPAASDL